MATVPLKWRLDPSPGSPDAIRTLGRHPRFKAVVTLREEILAQQQQALSVVQQVEPEAPPKAAASATPQHKA